MSQCNSLAVSEACSPWAKEPQIHIPVDSLDEQMSCSLKGEHLTKCCHRSDPACIFLRISSPSPTHLPLAQETPGWHPPVSKLSGSAQRGKGLLGLYRTPLGVDGRKSPLSSQGKIPERMREGILSRTWSIDVGWEKLVDEVKVKR